METFREFLSKAAIPLGRALTALGVSPHLVSFFGIIFGFVSAYLFVTHHWLLAAGFFALHGLADVLDGMVARGRGMESKFGSFFDNFCSAYGEAPVFAALIGAGLCNPWWGLGALIGTLTRLLTFRLEGLAPKNEAEAMRSRFPGALFGKGDRIVLTALGAAFGNFTPAMAIIAVGSNLVAAHRCYHLYRLEGRRWNA